MLTNNYNAQLFPNQEAVDQYILDTEEYVDQVSDEESALKLYKRIALLETVSDFFFVPEIVFSWEEMALSYIESKRGQFKSFQYEHMKKIYNRGVSEFLALEKNIAASPQYHERLFSILFTFNIEIRHFNRLCVKYDEPMFDHIHFSDMKMQQKYIDWQKKSIKEDLHGEN